MEMNRFLYEYSVSALKHLIIPFVLGKMDGKLIYSYKLLSELGHRGQFHKAENPAGLYSEHLSEIIKIAKEHLAQTGQQFTLKDYFKRRYTYHNDLIIIYEEADKYFYDHYKPTRLTNVAAPKLFYSEYECIRWVKMGVDLTQSEDRAIK